MIWPLTPLAVWVDGSMKFAPADGRRSEAKPRQRAVDDAEHRRHAADAEREHEIASAENARSLRARKPMRTSTKCL
jgi:hypothetical protein